MRFRVYKSFDRDVGKLPPEHYQTFREIVHKHFLPAIAAGSFTGKPPWPTRLRIHRLQGSSVYSLTWSFSSPDGRATFHLETDENGEPLLVWRRIGNHSIYQDP
jgi:hypothetical protein